MSSTFSISTTAAAILVAALAAGCSDSPLATRVFEDATRDSGLGAVAGMTFGTAWGDFDGDGLPDLYVTNHLNEAQLFRNAGKGRFVEVTHEFFSAGDLGGDKHGAAWGDFDNDGRPDLVQLTGAIQGVGAEPKRLFRNAGGRFEEIAESAGVANPQGRTRMPLWIDLDRDGRLDLIHGAEARFDDVAPPLAFLQQDGRFAEAPQAVPFAARAAPFCILTDLAGDASPELVCRVIGKNLTAQVFDTSAVPARELGLLPVTAFEDIVAGDFDNDGAIDIFLARKSPSGRIAFGHPRDNALVADIWINEADADKPAGFSFKSAGQVSFRVVSVHPGDLLTAERVRIGKAGAQPDNLAFSLSPDSASVAGLPNHGPGPVARIYLGLTPPDKWEVRLAPAQGVAAGSSGAKYQQVALKLTSTASISSVETLGEPAASESAPGRLFMNRGGKLVEESDKRGINREAVAGVNAVAGDFDNDMDLDLFVVGSGDIGMQGNLLLLNRGNGEFDVVQAAGGADGARDGVGDSVTTVDFDGDGFLDLMVATGGSMGRSLGLPSESGGYHLYRNVGNGNHWLELDLQGTASNRDGIGARVELTAGGVTQVRIQDGGIHHRGQNHGRLHFGLGKNTQADKIRVQWPSGAVQELRGVGAGQLMRIKEPSQ